MCSLSKLVHDNTEGKSLEGGDYMIYIGVTGWRDHDSLYPDQMKSGDKLAEYSGNFLVVEVDASFYA